MAAVNPLAELAVEAIELESFAKGIPNLPYMDKTIYGFFKKKSKTHPTAYQTQAGGVARPAFRIPVRMQSGSAIFQGTGNGDSLGRGTGSTWISGDLTVVGLFAGKQTLPALNFAISVETSSLVN